MLVGAHDHRHRVPAHVVAEPFLERVVAGERRLLVHRDRVDVRRGENDRDVGPAHPRTYRQRLDDLAGAVRALGRDHAVEGRDPLVGLIGVRLDVGGAVADEGGVRGLEHRDSSAVWGPDHTLS